MYIIVFSLHQSYEQISMKLSGNVDNGPTNTWLHFGDVPDSGRTLIF